MRACAHKTDFVALVGQETGVEGGATAALAMGVDERADLRRDADLFQRRDDQPALPARVKVGAEVLRRAAAADAVIFAYRRRPLRACRFQVQPDAPG